MFPDTVVPAHEPVVFRELAAHWPAVIAGKRGLGALAEYLRAMDNGTPVGVYHTGPARKGRFFYRNDMRTPDFGVEPVPLSRLLDELLARADDPAPPALYAGSTPVSLNIPDFVSTNIAPLPVRDAEPRLWIGNASRIAPHYDVAHNLAVCVAGKRRFLLFPPEQIANLYVGPMENTLSGQPISMVDPDAPDLTRHPRYADALTAAQATVLEPGDAIYIPTLWWHGVRADGPMNALVNYWFSSAPGGASFVALMHSLLVLRDLPKGERESWFSFFRHLVFDEKAVDAGAHLPDHAKGVLGPPSPERDAFMRGEIRRALAE
ncbi:MAG: cupin-like domain-containing protein [Pacificimonas sp.]